MRTWSGLKTWAPRSSCIKPRSMTTSKQRAAAILNRAPIANGTPTEDGYTELRSTALSSRSAGCKLTAMLKLIAVARTVCLVLIVGYLLWALPLALLSSSEAKEGSISVNLNVVQKVASVAWLAIGWITLEVAMSWVRAWSAGRKKAAASSAKTPAR